MLKNLKLVLLLVVWITSGLMAQEVVLSDEFDNGDGMWNSGWIDQASATVTFSIDNTGKLSGANSYKAEIVKGGVEMWRIQRVANLPLLPGYQYTLSFMAVATKNTAINALFEIQGSPYTKRLDDTAYVTTTPQTFTFTMVSNESVPTNQVKFMFGGAQNNNSTIWIDNIVVTRTADPDLVTLWGSTPSRGAGWPILNREDTPAGEGAMGADGPPPTWATIRGGFGKVLEASLDQAVVVTGKFEYVGDGPGASYIGLRYALTYWDNEGELANRFTDSARWTGTGVHYGYEFTPRSGTTDMANGAGGAGTVWTVNGGSGWNSTWSNNGKPIAAVEQKPLRAIIEGGVYDFAISVRPLADGTNEIRWYMYHVDKKYWFGGTVIDSAKVSTKFNGICFGIGDGITTNMTAFKLTGVKARLGSPIEVPEAPWQAYYLQDWGTTAQGKYWKIRNDENTLVGDALISGDGSPINGAGWATVQGGFGQDLELKTDKALIVTGELEFVGTEGGGSSYTPIRYAITYMENAQLENPLTDSAAWVGGKYWGYGFHPRTGVGTMSNGAGGSGTVWTINNGNWNSTWSNNGKTIAAIEQAPRNAEIIPGIYKFAFSLRKVDATHNEIRWYLIEKNNKYWFGGNIIDTATTDKFNSICFGVNTGDWTEFKVLAAKVDYGEPIVVPEAPWQPFYVEYWGTTNRGKGWPILVDSNTIVGDAAMGADGPPATWATIRGGFGTTIEATTSKAIIVSGQFEYVGDGPGESYVGLRYALTYWDNEGQLINRFTPQAEWTGTGVHYGYEFTPRSGTTDMANGAGGAGTIWTINGGTGWNSTWSNNGGPIAAIEQAPARAVIVGGVYDFAISVQPLPDGTNEIRWYMYHKDKKYWFGGTVIDTAQVTTKFNGICFGIGDGIQTAMKEFRLIAVKVDKGNPITVPEAPWQKFYVGDWGFIGKRTGGWTLEPVELIGNATMSGARKPFGWAALRGKFPIDVQAKVDKALVVTGKMELVGGGFEGWSSLRMGLFYQNAGKLVTTENGMEWNGSESGASGYLVIPHSGGNDLTAWGEGNDQMGTVGAIINGTWLNTNEAGDYVLADTRQKPAGAVATEGMYNFAFSIAPKENGNVEFRYYIYKEDGSYKFGGIVVDDKTPISKINSFNIALNNLASATKLNLYDVLVDLGAPIEIPDSVVSVETFSSTIPTDYSLGQNYPNPFNPTTNIEFALPQSSDVKLVVYDALGKEVAQLVNGHMNAGYHRVTFNASNLASGVYFYTIKAGDFYSVKKLMLIK
ncbi:T9SS type A sorting domain-containing protein [Melioribacter sp. OK-6-Me]|uniref:T9SS type A sorting domain-containing protein n=1 Tax=unclassified Melioribacter TaxID=2627329 RepID=UPI003EDAFE11